jgi:uncharacterized membrane protein YfcA
MEVLVEIAAGVVSVVLGIGGGWLLIHGLLSLAFGRPRA